MRLTIAYLLLSTLYSCSLTKESDDERVYYVIKHEQKTEHDKTDTIPSPPDDVFLMPFYGEYNFILLDTSTVFYHKKNKKYWCGTGLDYNKPFYISLKKDDIIKIELPNLNYLLKNIPDSILSHRFFWSSISSPSDTIKNRGYKIIADFYKEKGVKFFHVRNTTEEEQYVLNAIAENKEYNPKNIKWKVGFGDTLINN